MNDIKLSIVTATYNSEASIEACLRSTLSQQFKNIEHIVIDGASTDKTVDILEHFASRDLRLQYISEPDDGIYDAFNKGVIKATGDFVIILGSDDWLHPECLDKIVKIMKSDECSSEMYAGDIIKEMGDKQLYQKADTKRLENLTVMPLNHPGLFISKKWYLSNTLYSKKYRIASDYELTLRAIKGGMKVYFLDIPVSHFSCGGVSSELEHQKVLNRELFDIRKKHFSMFVAARLFVKDSIKLIIRRGFRKWFKKS